MHGLARPPRSSGDVDSLELLEQLPECSIERCNLARAEDAQKFGLVGDVVGHGGVHNSTALVRENHQRAPPVAGIRTTGDVTRRLESVEAIGHAGWREHQRRGELGRHHHERVAVASERCEDIELTGTQTVSCEDRLDGSASKRAEPSEPTERSHGQKLEVRTFDRPLFDQFIDLIAFP